ncbi:MAG: haloacid dehalogenase-like hydrolase [Proteobacteria bacterium]|nr:haloacid dehalogenase-like hydrolase [Pseudomonadota bacterium]
MFQKFFKINKDNIFIISGGFKEFIFPVVKSYGIHEDHIFANTFIFDKDGDYIGYDQKNPLAQDDGKVKLVESFKLDGDIYVIGDGYTDYKLKELHNVRKFIAFTENIEREVVTANADVVAQTFDEFLYRFDLPRSFSYPKSKIRVLLL